LFGGGGGGAEKKKYGGGVSRKRNDRSGIESRGNMSELTAGHVRNVAAYSQPADHINTFSKQDTDCCHQHILTSLNVSSCGSTRLALYEAARSKGNGGRKLQRHAVPHKMENCGLFHNPIRFCRNAEPPSPPWYQWVPEGV